MREWREKVKREWEGEGWEGVEREKVGRGKVGREKVGSVVLRLAQANVTTQ